MGENTTTPDGRALIAELTVVSLYLHLSEMVEIESHGASIRLQFLRGRDGGRVKRGAPGPLAASFGGGNAFADALGSQPLLEMRNGAEDAKAGGGFQGLSMEYGF